MTVEKDYFSFKSFIDFLRSQKSLLIEKCEKIEKDRLRDWMKIIQAPRRQGKEITQLFMTIQLPLQEDRTKFILLEAEMKRENRYEELIDIYSKFFEEKKQQLLENIINNEHFRELTWLLLSNINLLDEAYAALFTFKKPPKEKPETYDEFLINVQYEILDKVVSEMIFG